VLTPDHCPHVEAVIVPVAMPSSWWLCCDRTFGTCLFSCVVYNRGNN